MDAGSEAGPDAGRAAGADDGTIGVYVHVPFCERVCPYCDFPVVAARHLPEAEEARFVAALERELAARAPALAGRRLETVYLGGGTPSRLRPASVGRILAAVRAAFPAGRPRETTLEVNPGTTERARLPAFREAGVDRLSVGVQSFDDATLRRLGRAHRAGEARATLAAARDAGFADLSLDLIVGAPGQDEAAFEADLAETLAFGPEHVSAYALTLEEGTPFARAAARGRLALPDDDTVADRLERLRERLEAAGLALYEVSSYARPGREARHNRRYWERRPVLGVGPGAWSAEPPAPDAPFGARSANERDLPAWRARVEGGGAAAPPVREVADAATARGEAAFLALRTARGLRAAPFHREFGAPPRGIFGEAVAELVAAGLLEEDPGGDLRLTRRGWLLGDEVAARFVAGGAR
ncbi:MAG: radical SAM family heme chaperone HemW [Myxococcota bacterium]|nr:radical SAM family heme chaperone HemW [Myxococcota bacterium]